jgi:hypothetical protein
MIRNQEISHCHPSKFEEDNSSPFNNLSGRECWQICSRFSHIGSMADRFMSMSNAFIGEYYQSWQADMNTAHSSHCIARKWYGQFVQYRSSFLRVLSRTRLDASQNDFDRIRVNLVKDLMGLSESHDQLKLSQSSIQSLVNIWRGVHKWMI